MWEERVIQVLIGFTLVLIVFLALVLPLLLSGP